MSERTFIMVKPDGVQRGLVGDIIARFEGKGFQLLALRQMRPSREHLEKHYADLSSKDFFGSLIDYMASSPVVAMVWAGDGAVKEGRKMLGATKPSESAMGTIRGDYCIDIGRNVCHGSDSVESAEHEIALWFPDGLAPWSHHSASWVSEAAAASAAPSTGTGAAERAPARRTTPSTLWLRGREDAVEAVAKLVQRIVSGEAISTVLPSAGKAEPRQKKQRGGRRKKTGGAGGAKGAKGGKGGKGAKGGAKGGEGGGRRRARGGGKQTG